MAQVTQESEGVGLGLWGTGELRRNGWEGNGRLGTGCPEAVEPAGSSRELWRGQGSNVFVEHCQEEKIKQKVVSLLKTWKLRREERQLKASGLEEVPIQLMNRTSLDRISEDNWGQRGHTQSPLS